MSAQRPQQNGCKRTASTAERLELQALTAKVYAKDGPDAVEEAMRLALDDVDRALRCYRYLVAENHTYPRGERNAKPVDFGIIGGRP